MARYRNPYLEKVYRDAGKPVPPVEPYPAYAYSPSRESADRRALRARENRERQARREGGGLANVVIAFALSFLAVQIAAKPEDLGSMLERSGVEDPLAAASLTGGAALSGLALVTVYSLLKTLRPKAGNPRVRRASLLVILGILLGAGLGWAATSGALDPFLATGGAE